MNSTLQPEIVWLVRIIKKQSYGKNINMHTKNKLPQMSVRGGLWLQSDNTITATSTGSADDTLSTPEVFRGGDDQLHVTLGVGFNFGHWRLDAAADFADSDNEFLTSVLYRK